MAAPITPISQLPFLSFTVAGITNGTVVELDPQPFSNTKEIILLNLSAADQMYVQVASLGAVQASGDIIVTAVAGAGDTIVIDTPPGLAATLTAVAGPAGVDEVSIDEPPLSGSASFQAQNFQLRVYQALIDPGNSFLAEGVDIFLVEPSDLGNPGLPVFESPIRVVSTLAGTLGNATVFTDTGADWATFAPAGQTVFSPGTLTGGVDALPLAAAVTSANSTILPAGAAITLAIGSEGNRQPLATVAFWAANPGSKLGVVAIMAPLAVAADLNVTYVQNRGYPDGV